MFYDLKGLLEIMIHENNKINTETNKCMVDILIHEDKKQMYGRSNIFIMVLKYNKTGLKKLRQKKDNPSYNLIFLSALCPMLVTHSCQHCVFKIIVIISLCVIKNDIYSLHIPKIGLMY
jgi:hypothetical protein